MTLILVTSDDKGDLAVVADTLFGAPGATGSEIGPKIFLVPVTISDLEKDGRISLPNMGFAFAGNVISGQFTHAMASTCLQNLAGWVESGRPDVEDVAAFYANCAVRILEERRRNLAFDGYGFDGVIFGFSEKRGHVLAFHFSAKVAQDGTCIALPQELLLEEGVPFPVGSGAPAAREKIQALRDRRIEINPFSLLQSVIDDVDVPSVGGQFQAASADRSGVELRPVMLFFPTRDGKMDADFSVMGINIHRLGTVAGYVPVGTPMMAQRPQDLEYFHRQET